MERAPSHTPTDRPAASHGASDSSDEPVRLDVGEGRGPLWGMASADLNATLLSWPAGEGVGEQVNAERDVLLVVLSGSGSVSVDDVTHAVAAHAAVLVEKGRRFAVRAGEGGIRYLSIHLRRPPLQLGPAP